MFNPFKFMISTLQNHPLIGSISSIGGTIVAFSTNILTSDTTVRAIGVMSLYVGFLVGVLTGIIKLIELFRMVKNKPPK